MSAGPTLDDALELAMCGWEVLYLKGKVPAIAGGHGVLDATRDWVDLEATWRPGYNVGARVPDRLIVIDTDPRHGGEANLVDLADEKGGDLPTTLTCFSGRNDGGRHRYFVNPGGKLTSKGLPVGVDLKVRTGYVVLPPSIHPATGQPYQWENIDVPPAQLPGWLLRVLRPAVAAPRVTQRPFKPRVVNDSDSIADWFTEATTWEQILIGWTPVTGGWRHPTATAGISATIRHDCLFVYSTNTPFEATEAESPHGYTRFRAWAVLRHNGDLSAAAAAARELKNRADLAVTS